MTKFISIRMFVAIFLLQHNLKISAEIYNCKFSNENVQCVFQTELLYGCSVAKIDTQSSIRDIKGVHLSSHNDNSVKFMSSKSSNAKSLPKFDSIFCEKFSNLENIEFSEIKIASIDENSLQNCQKLRSLSITKSEIREFPEKILEENSKLQEISFGENQLTTLPENIFKNQNELIWLDLRINSINYLPSRIFASLENLYGLWLGENKIKNVDPAWFENLKKLEVLRFHGNRISELTDGIFDPLVTLRELYLSYNRIQFLSQNCFKNLKSLEILTMGANSISELPGNVFSSLINIEELWMHWNDLTAIHSDSFGNNRNLRKIYLQNNKINEIDEKILDLTGISEINLEENVCSKEHIKNRNDMKLKLRKCFMNYQPRVGQVQPSIEISTPAPPTNPPVPVEIAQKIKEKYPVQDVPNSCGKSIIGYGNIIGGNFVPRGAFPWIAALVYNDGSYFCGGTLVSDQKVVTAAHCMQDKHSQFQLIPRDFRALLGVYDLNERFEIGLKPAVIQQIYVHKDWNPKAQSFDADIAVLVVEQKISFDIYIQPVCLGSNIEYLTTGVVVGYGKSEDETKHHENIPKILEVPIHKNSECFFSNKELVPLSSRRTFCSGHGNGTGVCAGDSGSGLVVFHSGSYYLRGIVSSSLRNVQHGCDVDNYSVFTDFLKFKHWVDGIDANENSYI